MNILNILTEVESTPKTESVNWGDVLHAIIEWLTTSGVKLLLGLIVLFVLFKIINAFSTSLNLLNSPMFRSNSSFKNSFTKFLFSKINPNDWNIEVSSG